MQDKLNIEASENNKDAKIVGKIINGNEKVLVKIPIDPLNPMDLVVPIQINGYKWLIKRGSMVKLPIACVKLLEEAGYLS